MKIVIVDTNVAVTANRRELPNGVSIHCVASCARRLRIVQDSEIVAIDSAWRILREYKARLNEGGQPGVGDVFLKWLLTNHANPMRCHKVEITPTAAGNSFVEFPDDPALEKFDPSDRKFVAVSIAHRDHPPILNATDSDWQEHEFALRIHGIVVEYVCPDYLASRIDAAPSL